MTEDRWFTDHPPSERWPQYTRANAGEVLPTPASPLGQTYGFDRGLLQGFQSGSARTGFYELDEYRDGVPEMCGFFGGYFYLNLANIRMQAVRNPAVTVEQLDLAFFGEHPDVPPYVPHPDDDKPHLQPIADAHMQFVLGATEWPQLDVEKAEVAALRAQRPDLSALTDAEILDAVTELLPTIVRLSENHLLASSSSGIAPGMLAAVADAVGDPSIPMRLLAGLGDVDSAAPSYAMWAMSRMVRSSEVLTAAFDAGVSGLLERLGATDGSDCEKFLAAFDAFVVEYGSRGPNEWELSSETWETDPAIALASIDRVRFQHDEAAPQIRAAVLEGQRTQLVEEVRAKVRALDDEGLAGMFEGALIGGNMMVYRERAKTTVIKALHEARMLFRELGGRHAAQGRLAEPAHVFMLTVDELASYVADPAQWSGDLADRAVQWDRLWELEPPFFITDGQVPPLSSWARRADATLAPVEVGDVLTGVAGSPGIVRGVARIVTDPANPPDLGPGDIMVAPLTDPAWTPLFMAVDAVVVNVGGQVSHAIIVSRELGLPCVVSVTGATSKIPEGAVIEVNGTTGQVTRLT